MVPLVELRGAIPFAATYMAAGYDISMPISFVVAVVGNMLPVPFIYFFARKLLEWGADKPVIGKVLHLLSGKRRKGRKETSGESGKRSFCGASFICWHSPSGDRRMDWNTGSKSSGYGLQIQRLSGYGRCTAGRRYHVYAQRGGSRNIYSVISIKLVRKKKVSYKNRV